MIINNSRNVYEDFLFSNYCSLLVTEVVFMWSLFMSANKDSFILYVEIKCQLDATEVFIADLIACSTCFGHHYVHQLRVMCPV